MPQFGTRHRAGSGRRRKRSKLHLRWKAISRIIGGGIGLLGAYAAWASLQPNISIEVEQPIKAEGQFSPYFVIKNLGFSTARDMKFTCAELGWFNRQQDAVWPRDWDASHPLPKGTEYDDVGDLKSGMQVIRKCPVRTPPPGFTPAEHSRLFPIIGYKSWLTPWRVIRSYDFEGESGNGGLFTWEFRGNGLSAAEADWLHRRGHQTLYLNEASESPEIEGPAEEQ
jgi:hypothetical protein